MADAKKEEPTKPTPEEKLAAAEAEVDALVKKGLKALDDFEKLDQKQVDRIVAQGFRRSTEQASVLAKMAVEETGRGLVEDKATKNIFACEHVTNYLPVRRPSASFVKTMSWASTRSPNRSVSSPA